MMEGTIKAGARKCPYCGSLKVQGVHPSQISSYCSDDWKHCWTCGYWMRVQGKPKARKVVKKALKKGGRK